MKIISKFSDYYDSGIAYGIDENLRFVRKRENIDDSVRILSPCVVRNKRKGRHLRAVLYFKLLGFCGQVYPLIHIVVEREIRENKKSRYIPVVETFSYGLQSVEDFMATHIIAISAVKKFEGLYGYYSGFSWNMDLRIKEFFERKYPKAKAFFFKYQVPYFLLEEFITVKANGLHETRCENTLLPILKELRFIQVKEPIEAFQEISMFLGQLRSQEDNTVTIEDKYLVTAKGFDCYSFKKLPEKKVRKKC